MEQKLYQESKARLDAEGWCTIPDVIGAELAGEGVRRLWAAAEANAREGYSCHLPGIDPNLNMVRILSPLQADGYFRDLVENETGLEMARAVCGDNLVVANCTANIVRPGARPMMLHSDVAFILPEPWLHAWSVNIIWCLTDIHPDNGATRYIPGSHLWSTHADIPEDAGERLVSVTAKAGSIVVMDGRLWHTSGSNVTRDEDRALFFAYYSTSFLRPMINWNVTMKEEDKMALSPLMRDLLGLDALANNNQDNYNQVHWKGAPVGVDKAMEQFERVKNRVVDAG